MIDKKKLNQAMNVNGQPVTPKDPNQTMEVNNDKLMEFMKTYLENQTADNLNALVNVIRECRVLTPANFGENKQPVPVFIKNPEGDVFLPVYTDKQQIPKDPGAPLMVNVPYLEANAMVAREDVAATGIVLNPFTTNLVFKEPLIKRIEEVEKKRKENPQPEVKTIKLTEEQYVLFERKQFEAAFMPKKLFNEGEAMIEGLLNEKETYVDQLFEESYQQKRMYPYLEEEFGVTSMTISDELQLIRLDLPKRDCPVGACVRLYLAWNPVEKSGRYFMVERTEKDDEFKLAEITNEWKHVTHSESVGEGAELQQVVDLASAKGLTS